MHQFISDYVRLATHACVPKPLATSLMGFSNNFRSQNVLGNRYPSTSSSNYLLRNPISISITIATTNLQLTTRSSSLSKDLRKWLCSYLRKEH
jgi:hypothetical protein